MVMVECGREMVDIVAVRLLHTREDGKMLSPCPRYANIYNIRGTKKKKTLLVLHNMSFLHGALHIQLKVTGYS